MFVTTPLTSLHKMSLCLLKQTSCSLRKIANHAESLWIIMFSICQIHPSSCSMTVVCLTTMWNGFEFSNTIYWKQHNIRISLKLISILHLLNIHYTKFALCIDKIGWNEQFSANQTHSSDVVVVTVLRAHVSGVCTCCKTTIQGFSIGYSLTPYAFEAFFRSSLSWNRANLWQRRLTKINQSDELWSFMAFCDICLN